MSYTEHNEKALQELREMAKQFDPRAAEKNRRKHGLRCACKDYGRDSSECPVHGPQLEAATKARDRNEREATMVYPPEGVTVVSLDDPAEVHDKIAVAVGEDTMRKFDSGATRNLDQTKPDYEAFLSPLVLDAYGKFMHFNRYLDNGTMRDGDNWQKGIPLQSYAKSGWRHWVDVWKHHRGLGHLAETTLTFALCAIIFNASGYLHEILKARPGQFERDLEAEEQNRRMMWERKRASE